MIIERQFSPNDFQHCSTIAVDNKNDGMFLAYYTGEAEMHKTQHVRIQWFRNDGLTSKCLDLEDYTGNPVLYNTENGVILIYSKFENLVFNRIKWWQYCSLWLTKLVVSYDTNRTPEITCTKPKQLIVNGEETGYLGRCNPIKYGGKYLLPLYKERDPEYHGIIMQSNDGISWEYHSTINITPPAIQPTIFNHNGKLCALLRNFSRRSGYAYYVTYDGSNWSKEIDSPYFNANNSIASLNYQDKVIIIWNDDKYGRQRLSMGLFNEDKRNIVAMLDGYGSYPSLCCDNEGVLHVVYTSKPNPLKNPYIKRIIKWKQYDVNAVLKFGSP